MPKGYWIARVTINNPDRYPEYVAAARPAFEKYNAKFIIRGGRFKHNEGIARERNVVIEFADFDTAIACYESEEYQKALAIREQIAETDQIIIDGVE